MGVPRPLSIMLSVPLLVLGLVGCAVTPPQEETPFLVDGPDPAAAPQTAMARTPTRTAAPPRGGDAGADTFRPRLAPELAAAGPEAGDADLPWLEPDAPGFTAARAPAGEQPVSLLAGVVYFDHGAASLDRAGRQEVAAALALQQELGGTLRVVGHASSPAGTRDPVRQEARNLAMSWRRAEAVAAALVAAGAAADQIQLQAVGDNAGQGGGFSLGAAADAAQRRAEIHLDYAAGSR